MNSARRAADISGRPPVFLTLCGLGAAILLAAILTAAAADSAAAFSVLAGGMLCVLPGLWAAAVAFRPAPASAPQRVAGHMFRAQLGKWLLTAVLMLLAAAGMRTGSLIAGVFFASYGVTLAAYLVLSVRWDF